MIVFAHSLDALQQHRQTFTAPIDVIGHLAELHTHLGHAAIAG
jgi:hypothetical protein